MRSRSFWSKARRFGGNGSDGGKPIDGRSIERSRPGTDGATSSASSVSKSASGLPGNGSAGGNPMLGNCGGSMLRPGMLGGVIKSRSFSRSASGLGGSGGDGGKLMLGSAGQSQLLTQATQPN